MLDIHQANICFPTLHMTGYGSEKSVPHPQNTHTHTHAARMHTPKHTRTTLEQSEERTGVQTCNYTNCEEGGRGGS